jgi:hypothetical protein
MTCIDCGGPSLGKRCLKCYKASRIRESKGWTDPKTGRVWIRLPEHPRAKKNGYVQRAIVVLEAKLGRYLDWPREVAHHINEDKGDDDPKNLEAKPRPIHTRDHETKHEFTREELVQMYEVQGMSLKEIAAPYGLHWSTVAIQMQKKGIPRRRSGKR